jgi:hypothetical protein
VDPPPPPPQRITLKVSHGKWVDCDYNDYKIGETQMHKMHQQRG